MQFVRAVIGKECNTEANEGDGDTGSENVIKSVDEQIRHQM